MKTKTTYYKMKITYLDGTSVLAGCMSRSRAIVVDNAAELSLRIPNVYGGNIYSKVSVVEVNVAGEEERS